MRFAPQELLAGMLATLQGDGFPDDTDTLHATFVRVGTDFPLLARFAADDNAASEALGALEKSGVLTRAEGRYSLTADGRAHCVSSKRTLFSKADTAQLEGAALIFPTE
jgi:hypothetical protein